MFKSISIFLNNFLHSKMYSLLFYLFIKVIYSKSTPLRVEVKAFSYLQWPCLRVGVYSAYLICCILLMHVGWKDKFEMKINCLLFYLSRKALFLSLPVLTYSKHISGISMSCGALWATVFTAQTLYWTLGWILV